LHLGKESATSRCEAAIKEGRFAIAPNGGCKPPLLGWASYRNGNNDVTIGHLPMRSPVEETLAVKFCRLLLALGLCLVVGGSSVRANEIFKFDPAHSTIAFKVRHFLGSAKGKFTKFSGTIEVDREHPEKSFVVATIQTASIDTAIAKRDEHLRGEEFFNVQKFPEITFKSRRVKQTGPNSGEIIGDLNMHGVTRAITLHAQLLGGAESQTSRWRIATAPIKRSEFGLSWSKSVEAVSMIGDEVTVDIQIEAARAN
jgi:polyisoprenoid-binding protein YceI